MPDPWDATRPPSHTARTIRLVLEAVVLASLLAFAPLLRCPDCRRDDPYHRLDSPEGVRRWRKLMIHEMTAVLCQRCNWSGKITLLNWVLSKDYDCCSGKVFGSPTAASDFDELLVALRRAGGVRLRVSYEYSDSKAPEENYKGAAILRWRADDRYLISAEQTTPAGSTQFAAAPDEEGIRGWIDDSPRHQKTSADISYLLTQTLPRLGIAYGLTLIRVGLNGAAKLFDQDAMHLCELSDFEYSDTSGTHKTMTFLLNRYLTSSAAPAKVTLEYDLQPLRLYRRTTVTPTAGGGQLTQVEVYDEFALVGEIPDEELHLSPSKK